MKKMPMIMLGVAMLLAFPMVSHASMLDLQGVMTKASATVVTNTGGTISTQTMMETNNSKAQNMSMAFDNVSGIIHRGSIMFGDTGMWIGFGGTALAPTPNMFLGNMQGGGVIRMSGDVSYNIATNIYSGSGTVVEFAGTVAMSDVMKNGWTGLYGTPGAGFPGGGWMPSWGSGTGLKSMMPGWGGMMPGWTSGPGGTSGWGMMSTASMMPGTGGTTTGGTTTGGMMPGTGTTSGGYTMPVFGGTTTVSGGTTSGGYTMPVFGGTTTVSGGTTTGGMMPGTGTTSPTTGTTSPTYGGMMPGTGTTSPTTGTTSPTTGTTTPTYGGMMPGAGSGSGSGTIGVGGQAGMARIWVSPTSAAMITVNNGVPDYQNAVPVGLSVTMPSTRMTMAP